LFRNKAKKAASSLVLLRSETPEIKSEAKANEAERTKRNKTN
jgi:hypothetical protein